MTIETRRFFASAFMLLIVIGLIAFLTFIPVPDGNKDLIVTILGVLLGGGAAAMPNLFGDSDGDREKLLTRLRALETQYEVLKFEYDRLTKMLVERHVVDGSGIEIPAQIEDKSK